MDSIKDIIFKDIDQLEKVAKSVDGIPEDILMSIKFSNDHIHTHYPNEKISRELINNMIKEKNINTEKPKTYLLPSKIIFHNRQAIGDILVMTCAIRDFKRAFPEIKVKVETTAMHIWDHNENICQDDWQIIMDPYALYKDRNSTDKKPDKKEIKEYTKEAIKLGIEKNLPVRVYIGPGTLTNRSNRTDEHFCNAYRVSIEEILDVNIPQGPIRPDLYMSENEYQAKPLIDTPYWIINAGEKGDWTAKTFPFRKWQEVVEKFPHVKFVQIGYSAHPHKILEYPNVINFIGKTEDKKTGIRDLFNLFLNCEGSLGLVSFNMHLAAGFGKPCIVVAGAREPVHFTRYEGQSYLSSDGYLNCTIKPNGEPTSCWFCDLNRCPNIIEYEGCREPGCTSLITSSDVTNVMNKYYKGGRLSFEKTSEKSKLINIVKNEQIKNKKKEKLWGFEWGGGSITDRDWLFIKEVLESYKIKTILEFGAGLSTLLFNSVCENVITYETNINWIKKIKDINPKADIRLWDGKEIKEVLDNKYDLCFVDGPSGGENREFSTKLGSEVGEVVIVHDAGRVPEKKWQEKYLSKQFMMRSKGGHRCHLWEKRPKMIANKPLIKVVFNGRGEGGAERSTTHIMNRFVDCGYNVQYISPNGPSGTFRKFGKKEIDVTTDLSLISEFCDILFLYTNDWVWEFPNLDKIFYDVQANRKVMAVNYRLGNIGKIDWTKNWDQYLFLSDYLSCGFMSSIGASIVGYKTEVLPPPTDLTDFLLTNPNYGDNLRIVRHSSQGDAKYPKDFNEKLEKIFELIPDCEVHLMPAPTFLDPKFINEGTFKGKLITYKRNEIPIPEFLAKGNCFWYCLPEGYTDQGPKVIMEAQAVGLPIVADNHSGAIDRCRTSGFLCDNFDDHLSSLKKLNNPAFRRYNGVLSKEFAKNNYNPEIWIKEIIG